MTIVADPVVPSRADGVEWFLIFGYRCGIATPSAAARRLLRRLYAPFPAIPTPDAAGPLFRLDPPLAGRGQWHVRLGGALLHTERSLGAALQQLEYEVCLRVMAHRPDLLALHGATIFTDGGRAAAIITGSSGAGKTTLALALAARGYQVGGDDIAFIDPRTHQLWPLPRCFHLDDRTWQLVRQAGLVIPKAAARHRFLTPADLGVATVRSAPVRHVLLVERGPGCAPELTPLAQAAVGLQLLPQLQCASVAPTVAVSMLAPLIGVAGGYRLISGELSATVDAVATVLGPAGGTVAAVTR